ncbi:MAG: hypothetical protein AB1Z23_12375 [Eubacteriales bacterium]
MLKDSIKTVLKNPMIILGCIIPIILLLLCYIPVIINQPMLNSFSYVDINALFSTSASRFLFILCAFFAQFIYFPVLYNYIYEVAKNVSAEKGWISRGLKKNWWKIFVTSIIVLLPYYIVYFIAFMIFLMLMFSGGGSIAAYIVLGTVFLVSTIICYSYLSIASVTVVVEENFGKGLKNAFRIGIKNFLKVSLIQFIFFTIGCLIGYFMVKNDNQHYFIGINTGNVILIVVIALAVLALIGIVSAFIIVYINKMYMVRRPVLEEKDKQKLQARWSDMLHDDESNS